MAATLAGSRCSQKIPGRPAGAAAANDLLAGHDQVQAEVVAGLGQRPLQHLQGVDGGGDHGAGADQAGLDQQRELQVREAAALADPGAFAVDGHAAADHQVHGLQLGHADPPPGARRPGDGGGAAGWDLEPSRVEEDEGAFVGQAGDGHVQELAVGQGVCSDRELGGVGVALDQPGRPPRRQ
jgi:hypothetical protein